jgi:DNA-binding NarL/FixJ family response regulator
MDAFDAMIIDAEISSRMRLKQATSALHNFRKVQQLGSLREGLERLKSSETCDVVFISGMLDQAELKAFIEAGKQTPHGQDSAYVLVMKAKDQGSATVATNVLVGADGLLFEPYSVDNLMDITRLSAKVKGERRQSRALAAIRFLLTDVMSQLDQIAHNKASGLEVGPSLKKFKDAAGVLGTFQGEQLHDYYDIAVDMFMSAPTPRPNFQRVKYVGASKRIQARNAAKLATKKEGP